MNNYSPWTQMTPQPAPKPAEPGTARDFGNMLNSQNYFKRKNYLKTKKGI